MTKDMWRKAGQWTLAAGALLVSRLAMAVNDLPGGPAVNQLDLHPPVTQIAADQRWLHYYILIFCALIFIVLRMSMSFVI